MYVRSTGWVPLFSPFPVFPTTTPFGVAMETVVVSSPWTCLFSGTSCIGFVFAGAGRGGWVVSSRRKVSGGPCQTHAMMGGWGRTLGRWRGEMDWTFPIFGPVFPLASLPIFCFIFGRALFLFFSFCLRGWRRFSFLPVSFSFVVHLVFSFWPRISRLLFMLDAREPPVLPG